MTSGTIQVRESWGRVSGRSAIQPLWWRDAVRLDPARGPYLARGLGRSYGDACLNDGGVLLETRGLDRFIALDEAEGILRCEAGVSLEAILRLVVPRGLYLPVVPGTQLVTVGGAIANDVHGKNHHRAGTFGRHVVELELLRSSGERITCSPARNAALFHATVGGLGLTGVILSAAIRLERIPSDAVREETIAIGDLDHFFEVAHASDETHAFTVGWIDCLARGRAVGRGLFYRGDWATPDLVPRRRGRPRGRRFDVPFDAPVSPLNRATLAAFNAAYRALGRARAGTRVVPHERFFFPLDRVLRWNRIYGKRGLLQFQCAVPDAAARVAIRTLLEAIAAAGEGSFLAVLKRFGGLASPGLLSFPRPGATLSLDFPNRGASTARLFARLHAIVADHAGRIYPAKDACMSGAQFRAQYADVLPAFERQVDPAFSSSLWRRVSAP